MSSPNPRDGFEQTMPFSVLGDKNKERGRKERGGKGGKVNLGYAL